MSQLKPLHRETCVVRNTHAHKGRTVAFTPENSAANFLNYGRIILDAADAPLSFATGGKETGLICLNGAATVGIAGETFHLTRYDALYIPRDADVTVTPGPDGCDCAEVAAPVAHRYPLQFVKFSEVQQNSKLHFIAGGPSTTRNLNVLLGDNVQAGRIMAGVTFSEPGHWTSWPPHEHANLAEEAYLYIDMPSPTWGLQMVYTDSQQPELAVVVREGDCVLMPQGFHPNVAAPGSRINFLWMMAATREREDRLFGVVNVHPDYAAGGSGLEAGASHK